MPNIVVPTLGESVVEARVSRWLKQVGDRVNVGDALVSLETEKVDVEVSADVSGVLTSISRREGEDVQIGEVLGVLDDAPSAQAAEPAAAPTKAEAPAPAPAPAATPAPEPAPATPAAPAPAPPKQAPPRPHPHPVPRQRQLPRPRGGPRIPGARSASA